MHYGCALLYKHIDSFALGKVGVMLGVRQGNLLLSCKL